ncbi:MAG: gliding motility-associated C-terminal domain-containing protein, partial [Saprospiraceae bacterium]
QGAIDLNITGSLMPYTFQWSNPPGSTNSDIINLCEGEYCVTITHNAVCTYDTCFTVFAGNIGVSLNAVNISCNGNDMCDGEITAVVTGGVAPFTYIWSNGETTPKITNLCAGIYGLTVTDATGNSTVGTRTITSPPALTLNFIETFPTDFTTNNGAITVIVNGGVPNYTFLWTGPVSGNTASLNNLPPGAYHILVTDANCCQIASNRTLLPDGVPCFIANKLITPNDDGKNDYLIITCIDNLDNHLFIFNRNGGLVYDVANYTNNWNGVDEDNEPVADGGYLWVLEYEDLNGINQVLKGTINVLRTAD